jgi:small subunit ribosomal protein S6
MPFYENVFIARQDIATPQVEALTETFATIVKDQGGQVTKREYWGLRSLTYRIRKNRKGHYVMLNIDAPPAAVQEMERQMRISEDILRYLTTRVEELEEGPSAMMRRSRDDDERGPREGGRRFRDDDRGPREGGRRFRDDDRPPREEAAVAAPAVPVEAPAGNGGEA